MTFIHTHLIDGFKDILLKISLNPLYINNDIYL